MPMTTATAVKTDTFRIYQIVRNFDRDPRTPGCMNALFAAAADKRHGNHEDAEYVLAALRAEARHESHAFGVRACVDAARRGLPYGMHGC